LQFYELISNLKSGHCPEGYFCKNAGLADIRYATRKKGNKEAEEFLCELLDQKKTIILNQLALVLLGLLRDGYYNNEQKFKKLHTDSSVLLFEIKMKSRRDGTYRLYCSKKDYRGRTEFVLTHGEKKVDDRKGQQRQIKRALMILIEDREALK
jgi:hypothetical protein